MKLQFNFKKGGLTILLVFNLCIAFSQAGSSPRTRYNFNQSWVMFVGDDSLASNIEYNDATWKPVTLPRAFNEDEAFKLSIEKHSTGITWYRKHFKMDATHAGKKVFIEFEGVRQAAEVFLNGQVHWAEREWRYGIWF